MNAIGNFLRRFVFHAAKGCCVISQENCRILRLSTTWAMESAAGLSNNYGALFYLENFSFKKGIVPATIKTVNQLCAFAFCKGAFCCMGDISHFPEYDSKYRLPKFLFYFKKCEQSVYIT